MHEFRGEGEGEGGISSRGIIIGFSRFSCWKYVMFGLAAMLDGSIWASNAIDIYYRKYNLRFETKVYVLRQKLPNNQFSDRNYVDSLQHGRRSQNIWLQFYFGFLLHDALSSLNTYQWGRFHADISRNLTKIKSPLGLQRYCEKSSRNRQAIFLWFASKYRQICSKNNQLAGNRALFLYWI